MTAEELQLVEAYRAADFNNVVKVVRAKINYEDPHREKENAENLLSVLAVELVKVMDQSIADLTFKLATAQGEKGCFTEEVAAHDLLNKLSEFLIQVRITGSEEQLYTAHCHHFAGA